jgi:hypothetical protein
MVSVAEGAKSVLERVRIAELPILLQDQRLVDVQEGRKGLCPPSGTFQTAEASPTETCLSWWEAQPPGHVTHAHNSTDDTQPLASQPQVTRCPISARTNAPIFSESASPLAGS